MLFMQAQREPQPVAIYVTDLAQAVCAFQLNTTTIVRCALQIPTFNHHRDIEKQLWGRGRRDVLKGQSKFVWARSSAVVVRASLLLSQTLVRSTVTACVRRL